VAGLAHTTRLGTGVALRIVSMYVPSTGSLCNDSTLLARLFVLFVLVGRYVLLRITVFFGQCRIVHLPAAGVWSLLTHNLLLHLHPLGELVAPLTAHGSRVQSGCSASIHGRPHIPGWLLPDRPEQQCVRV